MKLLAEITRRRVLVAMIVVSCATVVLGEGVAEWLRHLVEPILAPLGDAGMYLTVAMRSNIAAAGEAGMSAEEQARLGRQCDTLRHDLLYWKQTAEKAQEQLDALLGFQKSYGPAKGLPCELIPARVVGEASLPYDQARWLNVGRESGAGPGELVVATDRSKAMPSDLAVVSASALVGQVASAGPFSARVMLVTDRRFRTKARIRRIPDPDHPREIRLTDEGRARVAILNEQINRPINVEAIGDGAGGLSIADVWRYDNVLPGDLVVTAEGPFLPLEVRIGNVREVQPDPKHPDRVIVSVRPEIDLGTLRDVFIVNTFTAGPSPAPGGDDVRWVPFLILVYAILLVQTTVGKILTFQRTAWGTVGPDLAAIVAVYLALHLRDGLDLAITTWTLGLAVDLTTGGPALGAMALAYLLAGAALLKLREAVFRERAAAQMLMALVFCLLAHGLWVTVESLWLPPVNRSWKQYGGMWKQACALAMYTAALMPLGHWALARMERFLIAPQSGRSRGAWGRR